jgi:hypothetical protein
VIRSLLSKRNFPSYFSVLVAVAAGCVLAMLLELWWVTTMPSQTELRSIKIEGAAGGGHKIILENRAPPNKACLRMTQHLLYREADGKDPEHLVREYAPLSNLLTGLGFQGVEDYEVELRVPVGTDKGMWMFATRSVFLCSVFPGLMTVSQFTTTPREIELK